MAQVQLKDLGEFSFIESIKNNIQLSRRVKVGIGDDTAVWSLNAKEYQLCTTDMLVEGVHFTQAMGAKEIGHKALACSLSDIAAMGGQPDYAVVSVAFPPTLAVSFAKEIYKGLYRLARRYAVDIVGGDTVASNKIVINITLLGRVNKKNLIRRNGAKVKDCIFVTGALGGSLKSGRHLTFEPRLKEAAILIKTYKPNAMIDLSDGLSSDLNHICHQSKVAAQLEYNCLPLHKGVTVQQALNDGEDFELLCTLSERKAEALMTSQHAKLFTYIGKIIKGSSALPAGGFTHF